MNSEIEELEWQAFVAEKIENDINQFNILCSQFPVRAFWPVNVSWGKVVEWCNQNIGERTIAWDYIGGYVFFANDKDCSLFLLKWTQ